MAGKDLIRVRFEQDGQGAVEIFFDKTGKIVDVLVLVQAADDIRERIAKVRVRSAQHPLADRNRVLLLNERYSGYIALSALLTSFLKPIGSEPMAAITLSYAGHRLMGAVRVAELRYTFTLPKASYRFVDLGHAQRPEVSVNFLNGESTQFLDPQSGFALGSYEVWTAGIEVQGESSVETTTTSAMLDRSRSRGI